jgi:hypothetical protein
LRKIDFLFGPRSFKGGGKSRVRVFGIQDNHPNACKLWSIFPFRLENP